MSGLEPDVDAATETFDAVDSRRFFTRGHGGRGRPRVHVYRGDRARVVLGNFVAIEDDVDFVVGGNHRVDWVTTYPIQEMYDLPDAFTDAIWSRGDTRVEHAVTIGRGAKIMPGVHIGVAAQVLPFAVVTRDVPAGATVVGSPAREIGRRFDHATIAALERIDWDAPEAEVVARVEHVTGRDVDDALPVLSTPPESPAVLRSPPPAPRPTTASRVSPFGARVRAAALADRFGRRRRARDTGDPERLVRGYGSYGDPIVHARDGSRQRLLLGRFCSIARGCEVLLDTATACRAEPSDGRADVVVGNDVWLGMGVKVYPGVTIGDGAVAAAWSVVVDDVPPYAIVAGNPARVVRTRFDEDTVAALLRIRWWDWSNDRIVENWRALCSADLATFIRRHDPDRTGRATSLPVEPGPAAPPDLLSRRASA